MQTLEKTIDSTKPMFTISVVAEHLNVHQRTLRIYDEEKLLRPSRSPKGRRLYSMNDIEKGKFIQYMTRELGINLAGIKIISNLLGHIDFFSKKEGGFPVNRMAFIGSIARQCGISEVQEIENKRKLSKRGRKANA